METSIISYLVKHARTFPDKEVFTLLRDNGEAPLKISYKELEVAVKQVALHLTDRQLSGKPVLLIYQDMLAFIIAFLACEYAGVIPVPLPYVKGRKQFLRINGIIADVKTDTILCTAATHAYLEKELNDSLSAGKLQFIATDEHPAVDHTYADLPSGDSAISFIQYTSGSVGDPKGVVVSRENLLHNQQLIQQTFGCDKNSIIFSWLPFHHDMGLIGNVLHTIYVGCTCILMSPIQFIQRPGVWLEKLTEYKVTHSGAPNFAYDLCVDRIAVNDLASMDLSHWKVAYNGSEPVHVATIQRFIGHFQSAGFKAEAFTPCYGLAEATLLVAGIKTGPVPLTISIDKEAATRGSILLADAGDSKAKTVMSSGRPVDGMKVKIFSLKDGKEVRVLEEGEICISGTSVTSGYWNKDNLNLFYEYDGEKFLRTGDLGFLYKDELFVHGRVKEMLIVRGKNFYPYDIENAVVACDDAIEMNGVAVFALEDEASIVVVAEVKRTYIQHVAAEKVIAAIDQLITGEFGISPHDIILTTPLGIPRTTSGKLQRIKSRAYYLDHSFKVIASKTKFKSQLPIRDRNALLLAQVLQNTSYEAVRAYVMDMIEVKTNGLLPVTLSDETDLASLGVDSLRAMEIINTINHELGIQMDATKIYEHNTLFALYTNVEALMWLKTEAVQTSGGEITI